MIQRIIRTCRDVLVYACFGMLQVGITYLEIYNEAGYDLLAPVTEARVVEDLPRVHIMEDEDGRLHTRNLSLHNVASEEEALNLVNALAADSGSLGILRLHIMLHAVLLYPGMLCMPSVLVVWRCKLASLMPPLVRPSMIRVNGSIV